MPSAGEAAPRRPRARLLLVALAPRAPMRPPPCSRPQPASLGAGTLEMPARSRAPCFSGASGRRGCLCRPYRQPARGGRCLTTRRTVSESAHWGLPGTTGYPGPWRPCALSQGGRRGGISQCWDTVATWVGLLLGASEFPEKLLDHH